MEPEIILKVHSLNKSFSHKIVLRDLSFSVAKGEILGVIGGNGEGKSTLLKIIAKIETSDSGKVFYPGKFPPVLVWQNLALFEHLSVQENIGFGLKARRESSLLTQQKISNTLEEFKLIDFQHMPVSKLSGGQRQRVALARAKIINPDVLLLDEPFSSLDSVLRDEMRILVRRVAKECITVLVSHDREDIYELATNVLVLENGRCANYGSLNKIFNNPVSRFTAAFSGRFNKIDSTLLSSPASGSPEIFVRKNEIKINRVGAMGDPKLEGRIVKIHDTQCERRLALVAVGEDSTNIIECYLDNSMDMPLDEEIFLSWGPESVRTFEKQNKGLIYDRTLHE